MVRCQASSGISQVGTLSSATPALFTMMSIRPDQANTVRTMASTVA